MIRLLAIVRTVGLALFFGGAVAIALIVAPVTFKTLAPNRQAAGAVVGAALHVFEFVSLGALSAAFAASLALRWKKQPSALCDGALIFLLAATVFLAAHVTPTLAEARPKGTTAGTEFDRLHHLYERVFGVELFVALAALCAAGTSKRA